LTGARQLYEEVLEARRRVRGSEQPETLNSMHNLAVALLVQELVPQARELEEAVLKVRRPLLGAKHSDTSVSAWTLFCTLYDLCEHDAAQTILDSDLLWLLDCDLVSLNADQRQIQGYIRDLEGYRLTLPT